ncbi:hypothetical protein POM88_033364 [Heracleum sosnowskyi]|uniref:Uncharacterized protein n=1 Tax=Heracleum sosnowskyi TaxID=360622 RepID=A0AAD8I264_9APIA|nr:hypothetical protein POM88_033364 [Heracleum sosnowskyi]
MADEVINAGRFDQRTTHEERRLTLESSYMMRRDIKKLFMMILHSRSALFGGNIGAESNELERKRRRTKGKKFPVYIDLDDENDDFSEASSEERNRQMMVHLPVATEVYEDPRPSASHRPNHIPEEAGSSGSSSGSRRLIPMVSPSISAQKVGSLSA